MYDLAIIGGGPAGVAAGVYASRKKIKTVLFAESFGGQSVGSSKIENWIGTVAISGPELAKNLEDHLRAYSADIVDIKKEVVEKIEQQSPDLFKIKTNQQEYSVKAILIATGSSRKKLTCLGAEKFEGKGLVYCATCDGPLFTGKDVVIIGGGNSAFESASQLLAYAKSVTLLNRSEKFKADEVTIQKMSTIENLNLVINSQIKEIKGDNFIKSIIYENTKTNEEKEIPVEGVFVEVGSSPTTEFIDFIDKNEHEAIIVDPMTQTTSVEGIWAAGDCTHGLYHQNCIAVGDGIKALENIYSWLQK
ncbi:MAG: FAD-dependent oxidoreductase [Patescibacteria group bacterium]|nr:FAD-dependent oxidoreductase [Patescibacteria group bacterium]